MISQIDIEKTLQLQPNKECLFVSLATVLNHVVDVVNNQQIQLNNHECRLLDLQNQINEHGQEDEDSDWYDDPKYREQPVDPYAEQRKWIGCICRFWFDNPNNTLLDYLDKIQTGKNGVVEYYAKESGDWFPHCEPVLPTDNAIYEGGDNE